MSDQITYRNNKQPLIDKSIDPFTGSEFWSMEGKNVQFTWFDVPANTNFPTHRHESEQVTYVLEGEIFLSPVILFTNYQKVIVSWFRETLSMKYGQRDLLPGQLMPGHRSIKFIHNKIS